MKRRSQMTANRPVPVSQANPVRLRGSALKVKTGIREGSVLPLLGISAAGIKLESRLPLESPSFPIPVGAQLYPPLCTFPNPCQKCHYCLSRTYGPEYWLVRMPP